MCDALGYNERRLWLRCQVLIVLAQRICILEVCDFISVISYGLTYYVCCDLTGSVRRYAGNYVLLFADFTDLERQLMDNICVRILMYNLIPLRNWS